MMLRIGSRAAWAALLLALLAGCAVSPPPPKAIPLRPELFARLPESADKKTPGQVALLVEPGVSATATRMPSLIDALQSGPMVEQALVLALGDGLRGGVQVVTELPPPGSPFGATLVLRWVQLDFRSHPVPPPTVTLAFEVALVDGQGRSAWNRAYHDDKDYRLSERLFIVGLGENQFDAIQRLAHEAAWRLAQQVLRDLRDWLAAERMKSREL